MATASLTSTPTALDPGTSSSISVKNTGSTTAVITNGPERTYLRRRMEYNEAIIGPVAASVPAELGGSGSISYTVGGASSPEAVHLSDLGSDVQATIPLITDPVSTATTGTLTAGHVARVDATSAPCTRTLPAAGAGGAGGIVVVKKLDASTNAVTVIVAGSDTINTTGSSRALSLPREAVHLRSDGVSDWTVVASDTPVSSLDAHYPALWSTPAVSTTLTGTLAAWTVTAVDCTAGAGARSLPAASSVVAGTAFVAKKNDTSGNALTISRSGSDLIFGTGAGATTKVLTLPGEAVEFVSDGVSKYTVRASDTPSGSLSATFGRWDAIVDPANSVGYATVTAALAAISAGQRILVLSSTTETLAVTKRCTIEWARGAQLINSSATDAISTGIAENVNGNVADVRLINPYVTNSLASASLGTGLTLTASADTVTKTAHGLVAGQQVKLTNIVSATGVTASVTYYVVSPAADTFQLATTLNGSAVDITADGTADVTVLGRTSSVGINLHGALRWRIDNARVERHAKGVSFSATPYPSGQGSHNTLRSLFVNDCGVGVHNGGTANINNIVDLYTFDCSRHYWHESGLNPYILGYRAENLGGGIDAMFVLSASGATIVGLHCEANGANPALQIDAAASGVHVQGDIYVTTGTRYAIANGAKYHVALAGDPIRRHDTSTRASLSVQRSRADVSSSSSASGEAVFTAPYNVRIKAVHVMPNDNVNFSAGNYWTADFQDWNGNTQGSSIGTYTQTAQLTKGLSSVTGLDYTLTAGHTVRVNLTKTGAPPNLWGPTFIVDYDVA